VARIPPAGRKPRDAQGKVEQYQSGVHCACYERLGASPLAALTRASRVAWA